MIRVLRTFRIPKQIISRVNRGRAISSQIGVRQGLETMGAKRGWEMEGESKRKIIVAYSRRREMTGRVVINQLRVLFGVWHEGFSSKDVYAVRGCFNRVEETSRVTQLTLSSVTSTLCFCAPAFTHLLDTLFLLLSANAFRAFTSLSHQLPSFGLHFALESINVNRPHDEMAFPLGKKHFPWLTSTRIPWDRDFAWRWRDQWWG